MKKIVTFLVVLVLLVSCKKELVKKPNHLIEREKMVNIMYDLSILEAIKVQNPASIDSFKLNPNQYIFKKYKIDSLQFAQSNIYYAADYKEYEKMFTEIKLRIDNNKKIYEAQIKVENKKKTAEAKLKAKKVVDSIKKARELKVTKSIDSLKKAKKKKKVL
jgi:hypothetical protein